MLLYFFVIIRKEFGIIEIHKKGMETVKVQDKTRFKLAKSMKELMKSKPLDKITVTDIVENCDVSRQSFYRLFQDKYDLVNWYFEVLSENSPTYAGGYSSLHGPFAPKTICGIIVIINATVIKKLKILLFIYILLSAHTNLTSDKILPYENPAL